MNKLKREIIEIGKLLWDKGLFAARCGNISLKSDRGNILITSHDCCLGMLCEDEIIAMDLEGDTKDKEIPTLEKSIHLSIHKNFTQAAVIHTHPPFTNGYFAVRDNLDCLTFESRLLLKDVPCIQQDTARISNTDSVVKALKKSSIVVLKNHGVIAIGNSLRDAFFLIQLLENAIKVNAVAQLYTKKEVEKPNRK